MLIFTLLLIILNFSHHISETGSVKYLLQEANSCQEKDDFFTCVCNSDGWNKIQLDADCCDIKTSKNIDWVKNITKVQPVSREGGDLGWSDDQQNCRREVESLSFWLLIIDLQAKCQESSDANWRFPLENIIIYQIVDFWEKWREIWPFNCRVFGGQSK